MIPTVFKGIEDTLPIMMDGAAFRRKKLVNLAFVAPIVVLSPVALSFYVLFFLSLPRRAQAAVLPFVAGLTVLLVFVMMHMTFNQIEIARPRVSSDGVVPRKWTVIDILRRRRIIPWSEISEVRHEPEPGESWWITFALKHGGERFVRSAKGVPNSFPEACRRFARGHRVPFVEVPFDSSA